MRVLRQKVFSLLTERIREEYLIKPGDFDKFPKIVQNYYLQGINKDFYDLINLQGCHGFNPFPTPILDKKPNKDGYIPLFAENQDYADLDNPTVYYKDGVLFKKTGIFFKKIVPMSDLEFKSFLLNSMINEDDLGQEWKQHPNGNRIIAIEEKMERKINRL